MNDFEIILNLWYVYGVDGLIYSLRARAYVHKGNEEQKLEFLQGFAEKDYLIAQPFPIPDCYHMEIITKVCKKKLPVFPTNLLDVHGGPVTIANLYEEVFRQIEKQLPVQTNLTISRDPLICVTPLLGDDYGNITPKFDSRSRFDS